MSAVHNMHSSRHLKNFMTKNQSKTLEILSFGFIQKTKIESQNITYGFTGNTYSEGTRCNLVESDARTFACVYVSHVQFAVGIPVSTHL